MAHCGLQDQPRPTITNLGIRRRLANNKTGPRISPARSFLPHELPWCANLGGERCRPPPALWPRIHNKVQTGGQTRQYFSVQRRLRALQVCKPACLHVCMTTSGPTLRRTRFRTGCASQRARISLPCGCVKTRRSAPLLSPAVRNPSPALFPDGQNTAHFDSDSPRPRDVSCCQVSSGHLINHLGQDVGSCTGYSAAEEHDCLSVYLGTMYLGRHAFVASPVRKGPHPKEAW